MAIRILILLTAFASQSLAADEQCVDIWASVEVDGDRVHFVGLMLPFVAASERVFSGGTWPHLVRLKAILNDDGVIELNVAFELNSHGCSEKTEHTYQPAIGDENQVAALQCHDETFTLVLTVRDVKSIPGGCW